MASFYSNYKTSSGPQKPAPQDDEDVAGFGEPFGGTFGNPNPLPPPKPPKPGATSPAGQIAQTGNTGMNQGGGPGTPQTTTGTPSSATGSGLPAYGSNFNFSWMNGNSSNSVGAPDASTQYTAPQSLAAMGIDFSKLPNYTPGGVAGGAFAPGGGDSSAAHTALQSILSGDGSGMDTSALKNRLKEQRLAMEQDQLGAARQSAASRGMLDSGIHSGVERRIGSDARKDILGGFRDVDIAAAEAGVKNKLTASQYLDALLTGDMSRADTVWQNNFKRDAQLDDEARYAASFGLEKEKAALDAAMGVETNKQKGAGINLDSWKAGAEATQKSRDQDIDVAKAKTNELVARLGLAVNLEEIASADSRTKMQFLTDIFRTLVDQEQFNAQMGLNYNQLGMNMNEILANVAKSIGA